MDHLPGDILAHLLSESISDPRGMALCADELWKILGRSISVQALSHHQGEDVYAVPQDSLSRSGACGSRPWSSSRGAVVDDGRRSVASLVC